MVTDLDQPETISRPVTSTGTPGPSGRSRIALVVALCALGVGVIFVAHNARHGAVAARIANPAHHVAPSTVAPLFGWTHWLGLLQMFTVIAVVQLIVIFAIAWWRYPKHPILLMAIVCTTLVWQDPIMNWAPYAVYNPALWHWPENWPLVSISPTVEPFVVIGYVMFYLVPGLIGIWVLHRIQRRRPVTSFVWTHPLVTLGLLIFVIGFVYDAIQEMILVRTQMYIYSQVIPFGSVFTGKPYQFPLLWESALVTTVMIPAGVLLYRDDTGRTVAEKLAHRVRAFRGYPALGTFAGDVRHPQRVLLLPLRRRLCDHPGERRGHLGRVSLSLSDDEGLRPAGLLREGGPARSLLRGHLGRLGDRSVRTPERDPSEQRRAL